MSQAHINIYDTINNRSNIVDPKNPNNTSRNFVYKNDPWSKGSDYNSYPYIIARFPDLELDATSIDGKSKDISWKMKISVRTLIGGAVNNLNNESSGITDMYSIIDDLNQTFNSETVKASLRLNNVYNLNLSVVDNDEFQDSNKKRILETDMVLEFDTRMDVSS